MKWGAYARLMRLHKPVGILLLWFPTAIALWMAHSGVPPFDLTLLFLSGTVVMRSAGCVINDLADRHIDKDVRRTALRPLTTGELSVRHALILFMLLLVIAALIVIQLPMACFYYACLGLLITIIYPFCKRWIQAPQLVLSLAFSVSIPMVYIASHTPFNQDMGLLLLMNILWVVAYDTMYAMVDREDDRVLGVQSTAVLFGRYDCWIIALLHLLMHALWLGIAYHLQCHALFYVGWGGGALILGYQHNLIAHRKPEDCFKAFHWSVAYGFVMWLSVCTI